VIVADIGITEEALASIAPKTTENLPGQWKAEFPWPKPQNHKYHRGHTLVIGGPVTHVGAAKLAAGSALRIGSGLVTIVCDAKDIPVYAASALSVMTEAQQHWKTLLKDARRNTVLIGPGAGVNKRTRDQVLTALKARKSAVLDADALTAFAKEPDVLFKAIHSPAILTPHEGEFAKLFPRIRQGSKLQRALKAAALSCAVVVLKGYDTVIASPDGRASVNTNAPATLVTAGAGDVLSGICAGLLAQGMEPFDAARAAVWIHGEAARRRGAGLIAEDLPLLVPGVLEMLKNI